MSSSSHCLDSGQSLVAQPPPERRKTLPRRLWQLLQVTARALALVVSVLVAGEAAAQTEQGTARPESSVSDATAKESTSAPADDADLLKSIRFGVTLEGYYQYNWNHPPDRVIPLRAYDTRSNVFSLQQAAIVIDGAPDVAAGRRFGARVDLQFGQATETVQGNPANEPRPDQYRYLWQAYGSYVFPVGPQGLQADFGKYASMLGYETNYAKDNQSFSRAYLFNFLPFYHSGLRLTLPINDKVSVLYMLSNGIQQTEDFNDFKSQHVAAILKPASAVTWTVNYYFGQEQPDGGEPGGPDGFFKVFDTNVAFTPMPRLSLALDANYVTNEINKGSPSLALQGVGAYARYEATDTAAFGVRYERLDDEGLFAGVRQVLHETTLTAEHKLADGFLIRGEYRRDWSNEPFFTGRLGATDARRHQNTALIGGVWWFGTKQGAW